MTLVFGRTADPAAATPATALVRTPGRGKAAALELQAAAAKHHFSFRELLSELNPLQYIPVIGTLFRAVTGDVIPELVRDAGSMVFSAVVAGPIGVAVSLGELVAEKLTGIDPEKIGDRLLADVGIGGTKRVGVPDGQVAKTAAPVEAPTAWSHAQLAAYGVTTNASGELAQGGLSGSDVLNGLELNHIRTQEATVRYATTANAG